MSTLGHNSHAGIPHKHRAPKTPEAAKGGFGLSPSDWAALCRNHGAAPEDAAKGGERTSIADQGGVPLGSKEHDDVMVAFERWPSKPSGRLNRERDTSFRQMGHLYEDGAVNESFRAYLAGYSYAKAVLAGDVHDIRAAKDQRIAELERRRDGVISRLRDALTVVPEESVVRQDIAWAIAVLSPVQEEAGT